MNELALLLKYGAEMGITAPAIVAVLILNKINNKFQDFDKRLTVVETKIEKGG